MVCGVWFLFVFISVRLNNESRINYCCFSESKTGGLPVTQLVIVPL